jgi:hypothetical protein
VTPTRRLVFGLVLGGLATDALACGREEPRPKDAVVSEPTAATGNTASAPPSAARPTAPAVETSAAGTDDDRDICPRICARSAPLRCAQASNCVAGCEQMRAMPTCREALSAALRCFATLPLQAWVCDDTGLPSVKDGQCDPEQAGVAACMKNAPP